MKIMEKSGKKLVWWVLLVAAFAIDSVHGFSRTDVGKHDLTFHVLPKNVPIPPSTPVYDRPSPPLSRHRGFKNQNDGASVAYFGPYRAGKLDLTFHVLPKGVPIPPSGPYNGPPSYDRPPPPLATKLCDSPTTTTIE